MNLSSSNNYTGIIGAGIFGLTIARLLAINTSVLIFSRQKEVVDQINKQHKCFHIHLPPNVQATSDINLFTECCRVIFPVVPSDSFRKMVRNFSSYLKPYHILIHVTKGFDLYRMEADELISRNNVFTMSEVIEQESPVLKIGCLAGPNLAKEILDGQPTATVIASQFKEVIETGQELLNSSKFFVFGSYDLKGSELAGALKNIVALGSGILHGKGMGKNMQAMVITRGLSEMIHFGKAMGAKTRSFLGTAGIGDLVATASSPDSRNFSVGVQIGQGKKLKDINPELIEVAEGLRTLRIMHPIAKYHKINVPITNTLHKVIYDEFDIDKAINYLMNYPYGIDVDFWDQPDEGI